MDKAKGFSLLIRILKKSRWMYGIVTLYAVVFLTSCSSLEKASRHGFNSGYYKLKSGNTLDQNVYADVTDEKIDVYQVTDNKPRKDVSLSIPLNQPDSLLKIPIVFTKKSLDIDITAILLKYRPSVGGLPGQMTTDFNVALYAGWRHDNYIVKGYQDPLGKNYRRIINRGYDFGIFAGPGATPISPFTTKNLVTYEYSGMVIQTGVAGFLESNVASFGIALGLDYLLNADREVWIYNNKPWIGFIVGIALN
jgi:hypothetical protein